MIKQTRHLALILLSTTILAPAALHAQAALPTGGQVVAGQAQITTPANGAMQITQTSDRAVIDWTNFSIGAGNRVDIAQPSATAALLNRVTGNATSEIAGQLNANGRVFLVNPNGILITRTGSVNAAGFVASTLDIANKDFMAGSDTLTVTAPRTPMSITILKGGYGALMRGTLADRDLILAQVRSVDTEGGTRRALDVSGDGSLQVAMPAGGIAVAGTINASQVVLQAGTAREAARGTVNLTGTIRATGASLVGGTVVLTGDTINLTGATIDASGARGGGSVRIGGDMQGGGTLATASRLTVDAASTIRADATGTGHGGSVVLWSDAATGFAGTISARGAGGGDGGQAEVSSKGLLGYTGAVDLTGTRFGTLLLDPYNVTISNAASSNQGGFTATGDDSVINATILNTALTTANVTVSTGSAGNQAGNITVAAPITWNAGTQLTLDAPAGSIAINAPISVTGGGQVALNFSTSDPITGGLGFAPGGTLTYADGQTGQALTMNGNPYTLLYTMAAVDAIDSTGLSGRYALAHDLDAYALRITYDHSLVADTSDYRLAFTGTLDGLGHSISNLVLYKYISKSSPDNAGLVGYLRGGTLRNLSLLGVDVVGDENVGGLVGLNENGTVSNVYVTDMVDGDGYNRSKVGGYKNVGGLVGFNLNGTVSNVYVTGEVWGQTNVGGLVGHNYSGTVSNSYATSDSYATSTVMGKENIGGLVGSSEYGRLSNVYATGMVSGNLHVGGLVGFINGDVSYRRVDVINAYATGAVNGGSVFAAGSEVGGLVGFNIGGTVSNVYATGAVNAGTTRPDGTTLTAGSNVGGLVGYNYGQVLNAYATGAVNGTSSNIGGLVGLNRSVVSNVYATGAVSGLDTAGGLVVLNDASEVYNAYATGPVRVVNTFGGGLVGLNDGGQVYNAYATGAVTGKDHVGGLVGADNNGIINKGYWDTQTSGIATDNTSVAIGLTTLAFQTASAAINLGSAFAGGSGLYPYLASFFPGGVQAISGTAYSSGGTVAAMAKIGFYRAGSPVGGGTVLSGANGYYYSIVPTGTISANGDALGQTITLASATSASGFVYADALALDGNGNLSGQSVTSGLRSFTTATQNWSALASALPTTFGSALYADLGPTLAGTSADVVATNAAGFTLDTALTVNAGHFSLASAGNVVLGASLSSTGTMSLTGAGTISQIAGMITADTLTGSSIGDASFTQANAIDKLGAFTTVNGALSVTSAGPLSVIGPVSAGNSQAVTVRSQGDLILAAGSSVAGGILTLSSGGNFTNNASANALTAANRWLIYSANPRNDQLAGLAPDFIQYDAAYGIARPAQDSGNGLLYTFAPQLTVSLTGSARKTYDGTTASTLSAGNYVFSGAVGGDVVVLSTPTSGNYADSNSGTGKTVNATGIGISSATNGTATVYGYTLASTSARGEIGAIDPATLTYVSAATSRAYGDPNPAFSGTVTGFAGGDTQATATTGALQFASSAALTSLVNSY